MNDDDGFLGTILHEQFHWHAENKLPSIAAAITELRTTWPEVPVGPPEGARSEYSSYQHLIVCHWQHEALTELIGHERSVIVIEQRHYYT